MAKYSDFYPEDADRERERKFVTWIEGPGQDLGVFLGDVTEEKVEKGRHPYTGLGARHVTASHLAQRASAAAFKAGDDHALHVRARKLHRDAIKTTTGKQRTFHANMVTRHSAALRTVRKSGPMLVVKALPKGGDKKKDEPKKAKTGKAGGKKAGAGGKTRYDYPQDKDKKPAAPKAQQNPAQVPDEPQGPPQVDPAEFANHVGVSIETMKKVAQRFVENKQLGGRKGFVSFMSARLKKLNQKHRLDGDYWGLVFDALTGQQGGAVPPAAPVA